jgi:hypothetical protein
MQQIIKPRRINGSEVIGVAGHTVFSLASDKSLGANIALVILFVILKPFWTLWNFSCQAAFYLE